MADEQQNNQNGGGNKDAKKVHEQYEANIAKLSVILGAPLTSVKKIPSSSLEGIVQELTQERQETKRKEVKDGFLALIEKKMAFDAEMKKQTEDLEKIQMTKEKEFNEAASKLLRAIEGVDAYVQQMKATVNSAAQGAAELEVGPTE